MQFRFLALLFKSGAHSSGAMPHKIGPNGVSAMLSKSGAHIIYLVLLKSGVPRNECLMKREKYWV